MIISSAFSSGLLLFGISLLYGTTGTLSFGEIPAHISGTPLQVFSFILLFAGFGFKISAVPFHLWTADVYEGAPVAVTSYLSVISKGAILFVMVSVLYNVFTPLSGTWYNMVFLISLLTIITGNLFALRQENIKRFLAFSSIAQVGFILIGISGQSVDGTASVIYFVLIYIFSNLAAFGVVNLVSALTGKENIDDYRAFYKTNPLLSWVLAIALFFTGRCSAYCRFLVNSSCFLRVRQRQLFIHRYCRIEHDYFVLLLPADHKGDVHGCQ